MFSPIYSEKILIILNKWKLDREILLCEFPEWDVILQKKEIKKRNTILMIILSVGGLFL